MNGKLLLAVIAGFVAGWWLRDRNQPKLQGGAAPHPALISAIMQNPVTRS